MQYMYIAITDPEKSRGRLREKFTKGMYHQLS